MATNETSDQLLERLTDYWSVMQRAQELFQRAAKTSAAKMSGGDFSIVDSTSVLAAYAKVGMAMAARPADLMAIQQNAFTKMAEFLDVRLDRQRYDHTKRPSVSR